MQTVQIQCPNGHLLSLEVQHLGKHIRCPMCQIVMVVPAQQMAVKPLPAPRPSGAVAPLPAPRQPLAPVRPAAPPPHRAPVSVGAVRKRVRRPVDEDDEEEEEEEDYGESRRDIRRGLKKVKQGLHYHIMKIWATLVLVGLLMFTVFVFLVHPVLGLLALVLVGVVAIAVGLASIILDWLTIQNLLACPFSTQARGLAVTYVVCEVIGYACAIGSNFMKDRAQETLVTGIGSLVSLVGYLCMIIFLKRLAVFLRKRKIADRATVTLILLGLSIFFAMITVFAIVSTVPQMVAAAVAEKGGINKADDPNEEDAFEDPAAPGGMGKPEIKPPDPPAIAFMIFGLIGVLVTGVWGFLRYLRLLHEVYDAI